jgi:hypothetical protein
LVAETWPGFVQDISLRGFNLVLNRRFEPGALLNVELQPEEEGERLTLWARVVHVTCHPEGDWQHGCVFTKQLAGEELAVLVL